MTFQIFDDDFSEGLETCRLELQDDMGGVAASVLVEIVDNESESVNTRSIYVHVLVCIF